ncbi:MAG: TatD family hydrolase [Clostridia bacterium]|nr:TatD family hydrolase [Clostridia bacterium]
MKIFDSHAHYFDERLEKEYKGGAEALLRSIMPDPVDKIVNVGTNCDTSRAAIAQAARHAGMYATVGIHPEDCHFLTDPDAALAELRALLGTAQTRARDKIVAIGEIGLDYHWQSYDNGHIPMNKSKQAYFFRAQMSLAEALGMPVVIHDREAHGDCFETVLAYPNVRGVFHSYSGSAEMARELVRRGWYVSFAGPLTFKNAERVREAARAVSRDRLLVETDAPYMAPHPMRGQMNHSGLLVHTLAVLAEIWDCTPEEAAAITAKNAEMLFQIG